MSGKIEGSRVELRLGISEGTVRKKVKTIVHYLQKKNFKVAVIGSGPAGCAAAIALAKKPFKVTVFESGKPGKDKVCGDALLRPAVEHLCRYGINQNRIKQLGGIKFDEILLYKNEKILWETDKTGWVIPRAVLDQELRNIASRHTEYINIVFDTTIRAIKHLDNRQLQLSATHRGCQEYEATYDAVIIATGARNKLSRMFGVNGIPFKVLSISVYTHNTKRQRPTALTFRADDKCKPGYYWFFPISARTSNVGIFLIKKISIKSLTLLGDEVLKKHNMERRGTWRIGSGLLWSGKGCNWHHPSGIVSCGDAAGIVNPYTGEGMTAALKSGEHAGNAISDYLTENYAIFNLEKYSKWTKNIFTQRYLKTPLQQEWKNLCGIE